MNQDWVKNGYSAPAVAFDFDGTLNVDSHAGVPGPPRPEMVALVNQLGADGWYVIIHSARPPSQHPEVAAWLAEHDVSYDQIALGTKPSVDAYVDDRGLFPPVDVLHDHLELVRLGGDFRVAYAEQQSRSRFARSLTDCHENPDWDGDDDDASFRVVVPVSAGMDSTTAWGMADSAGLPTEAVYVDTGAEYSLAERAALDGLGIAFTNLDLPTEYTRFGYVDVGRNALIILAVAEWMADQGWWGEIWFGNLGAEWEETPVKGGDKCHRFFVHMNHLLTVNGFDVQVASPLAGLSKADCVAWWQRRGREKMMLASRSCYGAATGHCGHCRSCFRRWLALEACGLGHRALWPEGTDWTAHIAAYQESRSTSRSRTMTGYRTVDADRILEGRTA